ncbi:hypothetical protein BOQ54_00595 [Chelatococcus daeguensis]|uniref:DUF1178 domain-containing protein n=1 Tax=Chelatococcus daeguensis TaxID=444444 RepID=A0AAC9JMA9_9HYPH|nr:DUF1178 family protein [Chelatococcus daeguensis]APF36014.1 hypothetical protein BOQ54_00595 [Chelatococcus daeguensis]
MIRYDLVCDKDHAFDSWFPDSAAYEKLLAGGFVACPHCGSTKVAKAIMAPAVKRTDKGRTAPSPAPAAGPPGPAPVALLSEKEQQMRAFLRAVRRHVVENAENVGERFPDEARRIHAGETEERAIYGDASLEEVRSLHEEGIEVLPLPRLPEEGN